LASLCFDEPQDAEHAVLEAVTTAAADPCMAVADPPWTWAILTKQIDRVLSRSPVTQQGRVLSRAQAEAVALAVTGHTSSEIALLMRQEPRRVRQHLNAAICALQDTANRAGD
jgi:hypothetical protein